MYSYPCQTTQFYSIISKSDKVTIYYVQTPSDTNKL